MARAAIGGELSVSDPTVAKLNDLTFELDIAEPIRAGGYIRLAFPFALTPDAPITCTATYGFDGPAQCAVDSTGTAIELRQATPSTEFLLIFTLQGIENPAFERIWSI